MFQKDFGNAETYYNDPNGLHSSIGVTSSSSSEAEFVCYCTDTYPNFMMMSSSFSLNPFPISNISTQYIDSSGFYIEFQIFPLNNQVGTAD